MLYTNVILTVILFVIMLIGIRMMEGFEIMQNWFNKTNEKLDKIERNSK